MQRQYDVGGVLLERPFKIRRLGHFGYNVDDVEAVVDFYVNALGFRVSDSIDLSPMAVNPSDLIGVGQTTGYFTRFGTDHHALIFMPRPAVARIARRDPGSTVNQMTWQVGSLKEVVDAAAWFTREGIPISRSGRDMPGSNWHTYFRDPEGFQDELYYGMEQIGWDGRSKPSAMYDRGFRSVPSLPQIGEDAEVNAAAARGVDLTSGFRPDRLGQEPFDVDGVLLERPFKIVKLGPVSLFVRDVDAMATFYCDRLGFRITAETVLEGQRCVFLRVNTEHHSLALIPTSLRAALGFSARSKCLGLGVQLATYRQLRAAIGYLRERGVVITEVPPELHPGIDFAAFAFDPEGHAVELYFGMEQVVGDKHIGRVRPVATNDPREWPDVVDGQSHSYEGEPFFGPWG